MTLAVQNSWGGPDSSEKRDWFAGAISDLFEVTPDADVEYLEEFMLQIMNDEFEINIEDQSGEEIAAKIVGLRKSTLQGDFQAVDEMYQQWAERQASGGRRIIFQHVEGDQDEDTDSDSEEVEDDGDVQMGEAPELVKISKERIMPRVDEDGFIEVVPRKKR